MRLGEMVWPVVGSSRSAVRSAVESAVRSDVRAVVWAAVWAGVWAEPAELAVWLETNTQIEGTS
jgi:hypothetical protein